MCDRTALRGVCVCPLKSFTSQLLWVSSTLFPSWVTRPTVARLQQSESFLLRHCLHGRAGPDIYSSSGVSGQIMHVFFFLVHACVCAPFRSVDRSWPISLSASCCCGVLRVWCGAAYRQIKQSPDGPCACWTRGSMTQSLNQGSEPNTTHNLELISKE